MRAVLSLIVLILFIPVIVFGVQKAVEWWSKAAEVPANIFVDAAKSQGEMQRPWVGLSQGGEQEKPGELVSLSPVAAQIKSLGVKYIRIDHVLEEPFADKLKSRIIEISNAGAIPFISLSYFPKDRNSWQAKVKNLVETVSGKNNLNLSGVYYEVWNEPDGPGFGNFSAEQYFAIYQETSVAVLAAQNVNPFKIGGPALADLRRGWLDKFLSLADKNHARLDFISWHRYSLKLADYQEDTNFILKIQNKYPGLGTPEKIISEWGSDPARSPIHNSNLDAAHLVAAARSFIGYVNLATKFEIRNGPEHPDSGWGILNHDGSPKPTYQALKLLNLLRQSRILLTDEGTNVYGLASRDSTGVTIILTNYDRYSSNTENVPIKISNLPSGNYRLTKYTLNKQQTENLIINGLYQTTELMLPNTVVVYDFQRE